MDSKSYNCLPEMFADDVKKLLCKKIKSKYSNLIKSQVTENRKVDACVNIVSDLANGIANDIYDFIIKGLNDTVIKQEISCINCNRYKIESNDCVRFEESFNSISEYHKIINECKNENYKHWLPRE